MSETPRDAPSLDELRRFFSSPVHSHPDDPYSIVARPGSRTEYFAHPIPCVPNELNDPVVQMMSYQPTITTNLAAMDFGGWSQPTAMSISHFRDHDDLLGRLGAHQANSSMSSFYDRSGATTPRQADFQPSRPASQTLDRQPPQRASSVRSAKPVAKERLHPILEERSPTSTPGRSSNKSSRRGRRVKSVDGKGLPEGKARRIIHARRFRKKPQTVNTSLVSKPGPPNRRKTFIRRATGREPKNSRPLSASRAAGSAAMRRAVDGTHRSVNSSLTEIRAGALPSRRSRLRTRVSTMKDLSKYRKASAARKQTKAPAKAKNRRPKPIVSTDGTFDLYTHALVYRLAWVLNRRDRRHHPHSHHRTPTPYRRTVPRRARVRHARGRVHRPHHRVKPYTMDGAFDEHPGYLISPNSFQFYTIKWKTKLQTVRHKVKSKLIIKDEFTNISGSADDKTDIIPNLDGIGTEARLKASLELEKLKNRMRANRPRAETRSQRNPLSGHRHSGAKFSFGRHSAGIKTKSPTNTRVERKFKRINTNVKTEAEKLKVKANIQLQKVKREAQNATAAAERAARHPLTDGACSTPDAGSVPSLLMRNTSFGTRSLTAPTTPTVFPPSPEEQHEPLLQRKPVPIDLRNFSEKTSIPTTRPATPHPATKIRTSSDGSSIGSLLVVRDPSFEFLEFCT